MRFKMYRNIPKPKFIFIPLQSDLVDSSAKAMYLQLCHREINKIKDYQYVKSEFIRDGLGNILFLNRNDSAEIKFVLRSELRKNLDSYSIFVEWVDIQSKEIKASYHESCKCTLGELFFWAIPEALLKIRKQLSMKHEKCTEGMAYLDDQGQNPFCMDQFEYPNRNREAPIIGKTWEEASAICSDANKRLCTEKEWQFACMSENGSAYPYGNKYAAKSCNTESEIIGLSGAYPECKTPKDLYDLSGNVYEWTASSWNEKYTDHVVKGGNWNAGSELSTCSARFAQPSGSSSKAIGFRCCSNLEK